MSFLSRSYRRITRIESLESRRLLAAINWDGGGDGVNWDDRRNWAGDQLPGGNDDVTIAVAADPTVAIRTNVSIKSLTTRETVRLTYPGQSINLTVTGAINLFAEFQIENLAQGGTWNGPGKIRALNNAALMVNPTAINCDVVFDNSATLGIDGNLLFNGTMFLGTTGSFDAPALFIHGTQPRSITGTGTFLFDGTEPIFSAKIANNTTGSPTTGGNDVTVGPGIKIIANGTARLMNNYIGNRFIFQGTATADKPTSRLIVNNAFVNNGTLRAANGGFIGMVLDERSDIGNLNLDGGGLATIQSATFVIGPPIHFDVNDPITVPPGSTLALSGNYKLNADIDISGDLILEYSDNSPLPAARAKVVSGYAGGAWNGPGFRSSASAGDLRTGLGVAESADILGPGGGDFGGLQVDGTAILIRHTLRGDANLDRRVDVTDFSQLAARFGHNDSGWFQGDFNYDGRTDIGDFALLAGNFNQIL